MYFRPVNLRINRGSVKNTIVEENPVFSWAAESSCENSFQTEYRITVSSCGEVFWDSGWVKSSEMEAVYKGKQLPEGGKIYWNLTLRDNNLNESQTSTVSFLMAKRTPWVAKWITSKELSKEAVHYFTKTFDIADTIKRAALFISGIGICESFINGIKTDDVFLSPAFTNYKKQCAYTVYDVTGLLRSGKNTVSAAVGGGWRTNVGEYLDIISREISFFGRPQLICELHIEYENGSRSVISSDEEWSCFGGAVTYNNLFHGETYDASQEVSGWNMPHFDLSQKSKAVLACESVGKLVPQLTEPVRCMRKLTPKNIYRSNGRILVDFGINFAGVVQLKIPNRLEVGKKIIIRHSELIDKDGLLITDVLRSAKATDIYIAGTGSKSLYTPTFTYHGFRYAEITGEVDSINEEDITAIMFYNDMDNCSFFKCGSPIVNAIQDAIVQTERSNLHTIATDCPQRDERMAWLNDATVRFEELPYNFDAGRMFPKIISDICVEQLENGAIGSVAPLIYGSMPGDPVCSSYLIAGYEAYMHYGNKEVISKYYDAFRAWNEYLASCAPDGIVEYGNYGDWAGPESACEGPEKPRSKVTPEIYMSTGYHYYNYKILASMARIIGKDEDAESFEKASIKVREAFLAKWVDEENIVVGTNSQGCLAFALWLDILPEQFRAIAADRLAKKIEEDDFSLTTGNLTSRYIFDVLSRFGYIDLAWKLIEKRDYPSLGFMLENGATTIWERFELKQSFNMNSHNHPMYGAVGYWFYSYIAGVKPIAKGWSEFLVKPYFPKILKYAEAVIDSVKGKISVKWVRQYGFIDVYVSVPFGVKCHIEIPGIKEVKGSGCYIYHIEDNEKEN